MNGLSVRFRAREFYKEVSYVFAAAFVDEGDVWSLSHVALALSGLGLLVAISRSPSVYGRFAANGYAAGARSEMPCGNGRAAWRTRTRLRN
jgi:hypothetical protein